MPSASNCQSLINYYERLHKQYQGPVNINRYTARWGFDAVLMSMSLDDAKALLDYYFNTTGDHSLTWFFYNYDSLNEDRLKAEEDNAERIILRRQSEKRAKEWREQFEQS